MKHPDGTTLALHSGGDLGWWSEWKTARHVAGCDDCQDEVAAFRGMRAVLPELSGMPGRMPDAAWNRLAGEMRANIRLGLAAGECVRASSAEIARPEPLFAGARVALAMAGVVALLVAGLVLERPTPSIMSARVPLVQATADGIQRRAGEQGFALLHKNAGEHAGDVTYTVGAQGTMGASYVDQSTGYVTMTKVYVE